MVLVSSRSRSMMAAGHGVQHAHDRLVKVGYSQRLEELGCIDIFRHSSDMLPIEFRTSIAPGP
jgi:hypothetical protein